MHLQRKYGGHQLSGPGILPANSAFTLGRFAKTLRNNGGSVIDLGLGTPLNGLTTEETAGTLLRHGISHVVGTVFFPGDESLGNPATEKGMVLALENFDRAIDYALDLRRHHITVSKIAGPSGFCVGYDYRTEFPAGITAQVARFYQRLKPRLDDNGLMVVLEYLRPGESIGAISSVDDVRAVHNAVGGRTVLWHFDTVHTQAYDRDIFEDLTTGGDILGYVHAHGPLRIPAGGENIFDPTGVCLRDCTDWVQFAETLDGVGYAGEVVTEPFSRQTRQQIPPLGEGLPHPVQPREHLRITRSTFKKAGVIG